MNGVIGGSHVARTISKNKALSTAGTTESKQEWNNMENSIQVFNNEDFGEVRALTIDSQPWFVAKDVCEALGLTNTTVALQRLDDDERAKFNLGRQGETNIITEAGLYSLIMASKKPEAKRFKRWVTHEVLPSIRRDGAYVAAAPDEPDDVIMARALLAAQRTIERNRQQIAGLTEDNAKMLPKAVAYDAIIDTEGTITITQAARYLSQMDKSMTRKRLFGYLRADGILCKQDNAPTKSAIRRGLAIQFMSTRSDGKANDPYARLTQKGLDWCVTHYISVPNQMRVR